MWGVNERETKDVTFMGVNINSLTYWSKERNNTAQMRHVFQKYGVDSASLQEVCMNWAKVLQSKSLANSLRGTVETIRLIVSHNKLKGRPRAWDTSKGGRGALVLREKLAPYVIDSAVDPSGLGHWFWYQLGGSEGIKTRIVSAYAPTGSSVSKKGTYWK